MQRRHRDCVLADSGQVRVRLFGLVARKIANPEVGPSAGVDIFDQFNRRIAFTLPPGLNLIAFLRVEIREVDLVGDVVDDRGREGGID